MPHQTKYSPRGTRYQSRKGGRKKEHFYKEECLNSPKLDTDREETMPKSECLCAQSRFIQHSRLTAGMHFTYCFVLSIYGAALS
jgi:hypothetical protein